LYLFYCYYYIYLEKSALYICWGSEFVYWTSLLIEDDGPGIAPNILPRLFEPFASTRLDSHGTGLGLAVAEGIIREHGGLLLARNSETGGAVFEIMLPGELTTGPCPEAPASADTHRPETTSQPGEQPPVHSHPA
jgi:signal transduction histidine kinase